MKLHENIHRIQSLLTENREEMIKNMIAKHGLYHAIQLMGGYGNLLNYIDHNEISDEEKINFIKNVVKANAPDWNGSGLSTYEVNMSPVLYSQTTNEVKDISYFSTERVMIDVYQDETLIGTYAMEYEELPTDVLDNVFIWMLDYLEMYS